MISEDDLEKLALLARLELEATIKPLLAGQINSIVGYIQCLDQVDTKGIPPMSHTHEAINVLREDEVCRVGASSNPEPLGDLEVSKQGMLSTDEMLINTPDHSGTYIRVPLIVE